MSEVWASDELIRQTKAGVELWLPVLNGDGWYDVSNFGQVRTWIKKGRQDRVRTPEPRILSATPNRPADQSPYLCVTVITEAGKRLYRPLHTFVLEAFVGLKPGPEWDGSHHDGDYRNNRLDNVRWCTKMVNYGDDKKRHGKTNLRECREVAGVSYYRCKACQHWKVASEFGRLPDNHPAVTKVLAMCLPCARERGREIQRKARARRKVG